MATTMNSKITFNGIDLEIVYEFTPEIIEDDTFGASAQVDIEEIFHKGENIIELLYPHIDTLEEMIIDKLYAE
jgi:hypothetical protein